MGILKAPLISLEAAKRLGKSLVFQKRHRRHSVGRLIKPSQPRTQAQLTRRSLYQDCITAYPDLTAANRAYYADQGKKKTLAYVYQNFMGVCLVAGELATEATLEELKDRIGDEVAPDAGTVNKHLADILAQELLNLKTSELSIQPSKELVVLNTSMVGGVETPNEAFSGGIPKFAFGYGSLASVERTGNLASGVGWSTLLNLSATGILETLVFNSDYSNGEMEISVDGQILYLIHQGGDLHVTVRHAWLSSQGGETSLWKLGVYDVALNDYCLHLKRPIQFNSSLLIRYRQQSGSGKNVGIQAYYRSIA